MRATASVNDLRLAGIAYDDKTIRVIANANGAVTFDLVACAIAGFTASAGPQPIDS